MPCVPVPLFRQLPCDFRHTSYVDSDLTCAVGRDAVTIVELTRKVLSTTAVCLAVVKGVTRI